MKARLWSPDSCRHLTCEFDELVGSMARGRVLIRVQGQVEVHVQV